MAMRGNLPAVFGQDVKINLGGGRPVARKANAVNTQMPLPAPLGVMKPLAAKVSTKPSDAPMRQQSLQMKAPASVPPVPRLPSLNPKPVSGKARDTGSKRPKTGMK